MELSELSSFTIVLSIVAFIALVTILVALLYKPGKRLKVDCKFKNHDGNDDESIVELTVNNIGNKKVRMMAPYIRLTHGSQSKYYQMKTEKVRGNFPRIIQKGEQFSLDINVGKYCRLVRKKSFTPTNIRIEILDTMGLRFKSRFLHFKPVEES